MSVATRLGLPETFQLTLLLLTLALALAPYLPGLGVAGLTIPRMNARRRRLLRFAGPLLLICGVILVIPVSALRPKTILRLAAVDVNENGLIDVAVTNAEATSVLLTAIEIEVLKDHHLLGRPALASTATYRLAVGSLPAGRSRRLVIRHVIPPNATERFLIAAETTRALRIRLRIHAAGGPVLQAEVEL